MTAGNVSDYKGAAYFLPLLGKARYMLADRGYDANWFREGLMERGIEPCIPSVSRRKEELYYNKEGYRERNKIERMFSKIKDWRRIAMRYDRCAHTFFSAISFACSIIFYL